MTQLPSAATTIGSFEAYLSYVNGLPLLTELEERQLFNDFQNNNDLNAAQTIVLSHLRFVASIARSYKGYGLPIEDLVQEGTIGLMKSVKKFSLDFGVRLSTFAAHYIKAEIFDYIFKNWRLVKTATTRAKRKLFFNLRKFKSEQKWLSEQEKKDVANKLNVSLEDIGDMELQLSNTDLYIDSIRQSDGDEVNYCLLETILQDNSEIFADQLIAQDLKHKVMQQVTLCINQLDERTKDIVQDRWFNEKRKTFKFYAEKYNVSEERIRQIEQSALAQVRKRLKKLKL